MIKTKNIIIYYLGSILLSLLPSTSLVAQINTGIMPESYFDNKTLRENIPTVKLTPPNLSTLKYQAIEDEKNGVMPKVGKLLPVDELTPATSGAWQQLSNGKNVWRLSLSSPEALGCVIHFNRMDLPHGAKLFVYNPDGSVILGPYTHEDNPDGGPFAIGMIYGEEAIVEYVAPMAKSVNSRNTQTQPDIEIGKYAYIYRDVMDLRATGYGSSEKCQVNINCSEGDNWRVQQRGVAKIYVVEGYEAGYCSGTLINNTNNDGTPYFLTADHCGGSTAANDFRQWIFYFNYESPGCTNAQPTNTKSISGCTRIARSPLVGGSDFLLVKLNTTAEKIMEFNGVYNGWSLSTTASPNGVGIHHPSGDIKKISTYTQTLTTSTYYDDSGKGMASAHWQVKWAKTENGHGVTEGGSSGSPLFDNNGLVIGTLSGGSSYCSTPTNPDLYGKMSYHWQKAGTTDSTRLQPWLDPSGTTMTCNYYDSNQKFYVSPTEYTFQTASGETSIVIKAGTDAAQWTATSDAEWLHISPNSGAGNNQTTTMTVSVDENTQATNRNATITVTHGNEAKTITITQLGTASITYGFSYNFEDCNNFDVDKFAPCTTIDRDRRDTYGIEGVEFDNSGYIGSFIAFNAQKTQPALDKAWYAYQGEKCGVCFAAAPQDDYETNFSNDDWFITPKVNLQNHSQLTFYAKSATDEYGLERFNVLVSNTGNNPEDFQQISTNPYTEAPTAWTQYTFDLSAYDNQQIYVAIQCVSADAFAFMIDDIVINTNGTSVNTIEQDNQSKISLVRNIVTDQLELRLPESGNMNFSAHILDVTGKLVESRIVNMQANNLPVGHLATGLYLLRIGDQTIRFIKQ